MEKQQVLIHEVGPRDGLQVEESVVPTERKLEWILRLARSGVDMIQVGSFVHPKRVPQMADTDGLFGTLAVYKGVSVHEYPSCKVDGFTISGEAGQPLNITFNLICDDLNLNTTEGTNTAAAMAALTLPAPGNRILFRQGTFLLNDATAAALSDNDRIHPSRFSLTFKRGLEGDYLAGGNDRIAVFNVHLLAIDTPEGLRKRLYGRRVVFHLRAVEPALVGALEAHAAVRSVEAIDNKLVVSVEDPERDNPALIRALVSAGADIQFVGELRRTLEDVYLRLVKGS